MTLIGADDVNLGKGAPSVEGNAAPSMYVAWSAEEWDRIFEQGLKVKGGPNGAAVAAQLKPIRDAARGYDFAGSPLVLFLGPATDNYALDVAPELEVLADGTGRLTVTHRHEARTYAVAPDILVRWRIVRPAATCPSTLTFQDGDKTYRPVDLSK